jgi:hypothetical protein
MQKFYLFIITCVVIQLSIPWTTYSQDINALRLNYSAIKKEIGTKRIEFNTRYFAASKMEERKRIIQEVQSFLFKELTNKILPAWYGTSWSFNGHSRIPGNGTIACGTFVVYTLQDVGFDIPSKMARQPSENIIKNLIGHSDIKKFWNSTPMEKITSWIQSKGKGIYMVGLDIHVGFIINNNNITFNHSSYYNPPKKVVNQLLTEKSPLIDSKYRVMGKILGNRMIEKWIKTEPFLMKYDYFRQ